MTKGHSTSMVHDHDHDDSHAGHSHGAGHGHSHAPANFGRAFAIGISLNLVFVAIEAGFGFSTNSLALLADAGHNLSDVVGLALAWVGAILARRAPTEQRTFGMRRASVLAALANAILLIVAIGGIVWEAINRLQRPEPVAGGTVIVVATIGILINAATALLFISGRKTDLNVRGAYIHMAADAGVSAGVVLAGVVISLTGWLWLDPAVSIAIAAVIAISTWGLLRDSLNLAMDAVPAGVDASAVGDYLRSLPGVTEVHDIHIWGMSTTEVVLTAHLVRPQVEDEDEMLMRLSSEVKYRFGIHHPTVQIERGHGPHSCELAPDHVV